MQRSNAILGLLAQTSIHAGTGQHTGAIDLPIQREGHSGWPCVFGSAVKGALRTHAEGRKAERVKAAGEDPNDNEVYEKRIQDAVEISTVFGPPTNGDPSKHAGALIVTDARLLLLPVRSLTSQFKWVTCPAILARLQRDAEWLGLDAANFESPKIPEPTTDGEDKVPAALVPQQSPTDDLFLEEYRFTATREDLDALIQAVSELMQRRGVEQALQQQLVVVDDDSFTHLANHATPVNAHVAIDSRTKTVSGGALWYEETLPPETLLYSGLSTTGARSGSGDWGADKVLGMVLDLFAEHPWLQLGGNETVGMGWCAVRSVTAAKEA